MHVQPAIAPPPKKCSPAARKIHIITVCCILASLWLVYFRGLPHFGLYNDDYYNVGFPASLTFADVWQQCITWLFHWPNGRPLSACLGWMAAYILTHAAGIHAIYVLPFALVALNSYLIYCLIAPHSDELTGLFAALAYAISPVDTLRVQYTIAFQYQACIAVTLAALLLYVRQKYLLSYLVLFCSLLFHECAILGFLAAPLLAAPWRRMWKDLLRNGTVVGGIIAFVLLVRSRVMGETRAQSSIANAGHMIHRAVESAIQGPAMHLRLLVSRAIQSWALPVYGTLAGLLIVITCAILLLKLAEENRPWTARQVMDALKSWKAPQHLWLPGYTRVFASGLVIFVVNYLVFFLDPYYPANHVAGMIALVHTAPGVGAAFCIAIVGTVLVRASASFRLPLAGLAVVVLFLAGLGAWGSLVRQQYEESWSNQRQFWKNITTIVPDATDGTLIIVETSNPLDLPFTWIIGSNSWADAAVPRMLYQCSWNNPPTVYVYPPSWVDRFHRGDKGIYWMRPPSVNAPALEPLPQYNTVVLRARNGVLTRLQGSLQIPAGVIHLKPAPPRGTRPALSDGLVRRAILPE